MKVTHLGRIKGYTAMERGYLIISIIAWVCWGVHICTYHRITKYPKYVLYSWRLGIIILPLIGVFILTDPPQILSTYLILISIAMVGLWMGTITLLVLNKPTLPVFVINV